MDATATITEAFKLVRAAADGRDASSATSRLEESTSSRVLPEEEEEAGERRSWARRRRGAQRTDKSLEETTAMGNDLMDIVDCLGEMLCWITTLEAVLTDDYANDRLSLSLQGKRNARVLFFSWLKSKLKSFLFHEKK